MTYQEKINESLQRQIDAQNARIDNTLTKVDTLIEEIHEIRADMREIRSDIREMQGRFYTKVDSLDKKIDYKFDKLSDQIHTMTIAAVVGFGAIVAAVGGLVFTASK